MSAVSVLGLEIVLKISYLPLKLHFSAKYSFFRQFPVADIIGQNTSHLKWIINNIFRKENQKLKLSEQPIIDITVNFRVTLLRPKTVHSHNNEHQRKQSQDYI